MNNPYRKQKTYKKMTPIYRRTYRFLLIFGAKIYYNSFDRYGNTACD